jgi:TonB family protein
VKKLSTCFITGCLLLGLALACKNPLSSLTNQYKCQLAGKPMPQTADEYIKRGNEHLDNEDYNCALGACSEALRLDPKNAEAFACRGKAYEYKQEYDLALSDFDEAIQLHPQELFYAHRSYVYWRKGLLDKALDDINLAMKLRPKDSPLIHDYFVRGDIYSDMGEYDLAISDYSEAIRLKPYDRYSYDQRAKAYRKLGKDDLAAADEAKAKQLELAEKSKDAQSVASPGPPGPSPVAAKAKTKQSDTAEKSRDAENAVPPTPPGASKVATKSSINGGVLNGKAISLPKPPYPDIARAANASGKVTVEVTVDENGNVISAHAVSGHPLLQQAAVAAARSARFSPTKVSGQPVRVTGTLIYNFTPP